MFLMVNIKKKLKLNIRSLFSLLALVKRSQENSKVIFLRFFMFHSPIDAHRGCVGWGEGV
jgi:hypothetical protein